MATSDTVLALLAQGPRHGYDLKREHDAWFPEGRPLAYGQVYATFARLQRDGLVREAHTEPGGGPERVIYELTEAGRQRVKSWVAEPTTPDPPGAGDLVRKAVVAARLGLDVSGVVARQRASHLRRMHELTARPRPDDLVANLVLDHAIAHLDADLRWLDDAAVRLKALPPAPADLENRSTR